MDIGVLHGFEEQPLAADPGERTRVDVELAVPVRPDGEPAAVRRPDGIAIGPRIECESRGHVARQVVDPDIGGTDTLILDDQRDVVAIG